MPKNNTTHFYHIMKTGGKGIISSYLHFLINSQPENSYVDQYGMQQCNLLEKAVNSKYTFDEMNKLNLTPLAKHHWGEFANGCFSHSHTPYHKAPPQPNTITLTCVRDPLERLVSHYNMLLLFKQHNVYTPYLPSDNYEYVKNFDYFITYFPKEFLIHQLYFFSSSGDLQEAFNNITKCTQILLLNELQNGFDKFYKKTGIQLKEQKTINKNSIIKSQLTKAQTTELKKILKLEYEFYHMIIDYYYKD